METLFKGNIEKFAFYDKETRLKDAANDKQSSVERRPEQEARVNRLMDRISVHIPGAAADVARLFVDALEASVGDPGRRITP